MIIKILLLSFIAWLTIIYGFEIIVPEDHGICKNWSKNVNCSYNNCNCSYTGRSLYCFGDTSHFYKIHNHKIHKTEKFVFCGWPNETFDPNILKQYHSIKHLRIAHSNLTHIMHDFPELSHLESINISWTRLAYMRPTLFKKLHSLRYLDLRWNKLDHMEGPLIVSMDFKFLYITGNPWNCTRNLKWLLNETIASHVADRNDLFCADVKYNARPLLTVMQYKWNIKNACAMNPDLRNCSCVMSYLRPDNGLYRPMFLVNCSNLNLYNLPSEVPENTTIFHGAHNQISNVELLKTTYSSVHDIYLDYNQIQSIDILESDTWLEKFRVFSLRGNKMTKLPIYALNNALEKNHHVGKIYLSHNPWRCDCLFTIRFQDLLMKYHGIIKDSENITCKYIEGDDNFLTQLLALKRTDVCKLPINYRIKPLDLVNGILGSLIVLILVKLAYDYYHYRKSGRLPWIATKIP